MVRWTLAQTRALSNMFERGEADPERLENAYIDQIRDGLDSNHPLFGFPVQKFRNHAKNMQLLPVFYLSATYPLMPLLRNRCMTEASLQRDCDAIMTL